MRDKLDPEIDYNEFQDIDTEFEEPDDLSEFFVDS